MMQQLTIQDLMKPQTQSERILERLQRAGKHGVTSRDLNEIAFRYSARILDLRKQGYNITTSQIKKGLFRFTLHEEV